MTSKHWSSLAFFGASTLLAQAAYATDFYVTDTADSYTQSDGVCSLREAVDTANYNDCWDDCGCGTPEHHHDTSPSDIVRLSAGVTYTLENRLDVWDSVTIIGDEGQRPIIRAADNGLGFAGIVGLSDAWEIQLISFNLTNFRAPALVASNDSWVIATLLTVRDNFLSIGSGQNASILAQSGSYLQLNSLTAIFNQGNIKGGGLLVGTSATVDLNGGFIALNSASQYGGGAHVQGTLNCSNSLITDNTAGIAGGGVYVTSTGNASLDSCTVLSNSAPQDPDIHQ
jgi:CSLREA domain-containing protein